jgi:hypothetical protein
MNPTREELLGRLHDLLDAGRAADAEAVAEILAADPSLADEWAGLCEADALLREPAGEEVPLPAGLHAGIMERVRAGNEPVHARGGAWLRALAAAACLAVLFGYTLFSMQPAVEPDPRAVAYAPPAPTDPEVPEWLEGGLRLERPWRPGERLRARTRSLAESMESVALSPLRVLPEVRLPADIDAAPAATPTG